MTAQVPETLIIDGQSHDMCTEPLESYLDLMGMTLDLAVYSTACSRGYYGTWEIAGDRLYLVKLELSLRNDDDAGLEAIFPGFSDRVFAHWYTGTLRVPQGKLLEYFHGGYGSRYERDLHIEVESGVVKSRRVEQNGQAADPEALEGYVLGGFTARGAD